MSEIKTMISREEALHQVNLGSEVASIHEWKEANKILTGVTEFILDIDQIMVEHLDHSREIMIDKNETIHQIDLGIKICQDNFWVEAHQLLEGVKKFVDEIHEVSVDVNQENKSGRQIIKKE